MTAWCWVEIISPSISCQFPPNIPLKNTALISHFSEHITTSYLIYWSKVEMLVITEKSTLILGCQLACHDSPLSELHHDWCWVEFHPASLSEGWSYSYKGKADTAQGIWLHHEIYLLQIILIHLSPIFINAGLVSGLSPIWWLTVKSLI